MTVTPSNVEPGKSTRRKRLANITVAEYLEHQIQLCGKTQSEIATDAGFPKANMITMLKQGKTKVPFAKIASLARALGIDPAYLLRLVLQEYQPEIWELLNENSFSNSVLTTNEAEIIDAIRQANPGDPELTSHARQRLTELFTLNTGKAEV